MSFEESFVERVLPARPIGRCGEGEVGQFEKRGKPDVPNEGFARQYLSQKDDGPCHKYPQGEKTDVTKCLNLLFKALKKRLVVLLALAYDEVVACYERDPSEILPAVDVLSPAQIGFEDLIGPFNHEFPDSTTLFGIDLDVDFIQSIQHLCFESAKWIGFTQA